MVQVCEVELWSTHPKFGITRVKDDRSSAEGALDT